MKTLASHQYNNNIEKFQTSNNPIESHIMMFAQEKCTINQV